MVSCPKIITAYQVAKVRLKWYKIVLGDRGTLTARVKFSHVSVSRSGNSG